MHASISASLKDWLFLCALVLAPFSLHGQTNVLMQHNDIGRTGQNLSETILTTANVNPSSFGKLYSVQVDGEIYAQPLYMSSLAIPGSGTHSVVFLATEHDSVYALDAGAGGAVLWQVSLLDAAHGAAPGATTFAGVDSGCQNNGPEIGVVGTPAIDAATNTIYLVSISVENGYPVQRLHALDATSGVEKFGGPATIQATVAGTGTGSTNGNLAFDPKWEIQRAGLLLLNGTVYIAWAGFCDGGPYHGWVMGYNASTLAQSAVLNVTPNGAGSGIWMSGAGLAADNIGGNPRMFLATGNGSYDTNLDYGDDVLNLNLLKGLQVTDSFTPYNQLALSQADLDLASGGVTVLPDQPGAYPHLAVAIGKNGEIYLLNRENLGGYGSSTDSVVQEFGGSPYYFGSPAYWNGNLYIWPTRDHLQQFSFTNGLLSTTPVAVSSQTTGFYGMTQSVSANQSQSGTGVVWSIDWHQTPEVAYAHDAGNVANTLWTSAENAARDVAGSAQKFVVPTIADGTLFVAGEKELSAYGLLNSAAANLQQDFSLSVSPNSMTVNPGSGGTVTVTLSASNGYTNGVTLSASGLPNGVTASFAYAGNSISLTIAASSATAAGTYALSINGASGNYAHSASLNVTVNARTDKYIPFLSNQSPAILRNNLSGFVGFQFTVGASPITVSGLGRYVAPNSSGTHVLKLVDAFGVDVPGATVSVSLASAAPNQYQYGNFAQPLSLTAKATYYAVSQEVAGGDPWYDHSPVTANSPATVNGAAYVDGQNNYALLPGLPGQSYVPVNFLYDPSVTTTSAAASAPAAGGSISGKAATLAATVVPGTQLTITSVQFSIDSVNVGAAITATPYAITFDTSGFPNGSHTATVTALDSGGASTVSEGVPFVINNATSVAVTVPTAGATVTGKSASLTATAIPAVGLSIASLQFKIDGSATGAALTAAPYTTVFDSTKLTDGPHSVTALVLDSKGTPTSSAAVSFTVNNAATSVAVTTPVSGATVAGASASLGATATPGAGLAISSVQFQIDGVNAGAALTALPYAQTFDSTKLTDGSHTVTAVALDSSGASTTSAAITFTVSNAVSVPQPVALLSAFSAGTLRNNFSGFVGMEITVRSSPISVAALGRIYLSSNASAHIVKLVQASNGADVPGGSVTVNLSSGTAGQFNYASLASPVILAANASYYLVSQETAGSDFWYDITPVTSTSAAKVIAPVYFDSRSYVPVAGFSDQSYVPVNLLYSAVSSTPPTVTITAPTAGTVVFGNSVSIAATASAASGATIANVQFQVDGTNFGTLQTTAPFTQTLDTTTLTNGAHALTAVATDSSGNSATSAPVSVTVSNVPPTVAVTAPAAGATITGTAVTISATAAASNGLTIARVQFQVDGTNLGNAITAAPYTAVFNSTSLTNGPHTLAAVATDSNGVPATSPAVSVTSANVSAPPSGTAFLSGFTTGTLRNNFSGYVGMQLTVGSSAITVTALGRIYVAGNTASHTVKLVNASTGGDVAGGSANVAPSGTAGQFTYVSLASPVSLAANTSYYLVSLETSGGDKWYDITPVTGATVAGVTAPVYYDGSKYVAVSGSPNTSYVPVNLQYSTVAIIPPTVSITSPISGATVSGSSVPVTASASAAAGLSIASVQFQVDGTNIGSAITAAPYATAFNSTSLTNGTHSITAIATDSSGVMATSAAVTVTSSNASAPPSGTALLTGFNVGSLRNNFSGYVGMQLTVGSSAVTVTGLGRIYVLGNAATHVVKLVSAGTGADVPGGSATVTPANGTAGQFTYVTLPSAVMLAANTSYYLVSQEISGGDKWYDITQVTGANVASIAGPVYFDGAKYVPVYGLPNQSYVPVNLQYSTSASTAPAVSITSPAAGATVSGSSVSVTASATPSSGLSITSVQFYVDSVAIGSAVTSAPYSVFLDSTKLTNGTHALTALAQDSAGGAATSSAVSVLVSNGGGSTSGTSLLTGFTPGTLRSNYSGYVGMQFKVLGTPITVTSLGRVYLAGNTGSHVLKLVVASTGMDVPGGSVSVSLPSGTAGQFAYVALAAPLTLPANTTYYLVSQETSGGDNWYDITGIAGTAAASLDGPVYFNGYSYVLVGSAANQSYVPLSFLYQ